VTYEQKSPARPGFSSFARGKGRSPPIEPPVGLILSCRSI